MSEITQADRSAAMVSVYYHGYPELREGLVSLIPDAHGAAQPLAPIALLDAAGILAADSDAAAILRKRRAVVKLVAGRWVLGDDAGVTILDEALTVLDAPTGAIEEAMAADPPASRDGLERLVYSVLLLSGWAAECDATVHTDVAYDVLTGGTIAHFTVTTDREFGDVARVLDPQHWAACSIYFVKSFVALEESGDYLTDGNGDGTPDPNPPAPGSTWKRVLFEHFAFGPDGAEIWFRNFLDIDARRSSDEFHYHYALRRSISSGMGALGFLGGLTRDEGFVSAREQPDGTVFVTGLKVLETIYVTNASAQFFLRLMGDEIADVLCKCNPLYVLTTPWWVKLLAFLGVRDTGRQENP